MVSKGSEKVHDLAPIIGITTYLEQAQTGVWDVQASFLPKAYIDAVTDAGGIALALPPQPLTPAGARQIIRSLDGLIIAGGADIDPARYGEAPHPRTGRPRVDRDELEDLLLREALDAQLPFLGICRGAQMLNVVYGGRLIQHLPDVVGDDRYQIGNAIFSEVQIEVDAGTRIADVLGEHRQVTAHLYHHQAIGEVPPGITVTSRTFDGIVQSVEVNEVPFGIAVQWHPEENTDDRRLFAGLVEAARTYRLGTHASSSAAREQQ